ncbi:MAG: hypothetical protein ABJL55_01770 [Roseibium sp.]
MFRTALRSIHSVLYRQTVIGWILILKPGNQNTIQIKWSCMLRDKIRSTTIGFGWIAISAVFITLSFTSIADAQSGRPDTRKMTCEQAKALVKKQGAVVMTTGQHTFERFIAHAGYCEADAKNLRATYAPTKDEKKCAVGYRCYRNQTRD